MSGPALAPGIRRRETPILLAGALCLAAIVLLSGAPSPTAAQEASVRAVETVDPSDGRRSLELMHPLTAPEVAAVQRRLAALGYHPGEPDGAIDDRTRRALAAFQREEGLGACGCVDVATAGRLDLELRVLVTRVVYGGDRTAGEGGAGAGSAGVDVVYPSTTRPERPEPDAARAASPAEGTARGPAPTTEAAVGTGHLWTRTVGTIVPVPVFVGGAGPFPGGRPGARAPATTGSRRGQRPTPFGRVPFPGSRPTPPSNGNP